jgi:D-glucuronyl C5-epimerase-like protein
MASDSLHYAMRALHKEILDFRFEYPLDVDPQAGTRDSLHYYLYSEKLKWTVMQLDAAGVPRARGRVMGEYYKPALSAWWGLVKLGHYLRHHDRASLEAFLIQVDWLERNAVVQQDGSVVWPNNFDCLQGSTLSKAPWVSGYDQGLAISAVVRGFRLTGRKKLLELLHGAARVFDLSPVEGGVRIPCKQGCLYAELPTGPVPGILDGFMTALLGLFDLFTETGEPNVLHLFSDGVEGLKYTLPQWDYRGKWSWYNSQAYLSPPAYHHLHRVQLQVLAKLAHDPVLLGFADRWHTDRLSGLSRAEIYFAFLLTKNVNRLRHRTWGQKRKTLPQGTVNPALYAAAVPPSA